MTRRKTKFEFIGLSRDWVDVRVPMEWEKAYEWFYEVTECGQENDLVEFEPRKSTGYTRGLMVRQPESTSILSIVGDSPVAKGWSLLSCSGSSAEWGHRVVSDTFTGAEANRIDIALDFKCSQRTFDRLLNSAEQIAASHGRPTKYEGHSVAGKSLYLNRGVKTGVKAGEVTKKPQFEAVLYEKGKQLGMDPDWRRFELRNRPDKPNMKQRAWGLTHNEILGSTPWSRALLGEMGYDEAQKPDRASPFATEVPVNKVAKVAKLVNAFSHMSEQWAGKVAELIELEGEETARLVVEMALFTKPSTDELGREHTGATMLRRQAQKLWDDVFRHDLRRRIHEKGRAPTIN